MSSNYNNLFNFSRELPSPFNTLSNKKVAVQSKYGNKTESTLCATVIKAVNAICACENGSGKGAVGLIDHRSVVEYKSSVSADDYHLVVYDPNTGTVMASVYNTRDSMVEEYVLDQTHRDGAAVVMAMMPTLLEDEEFEENFQTYSAQVLRGFTDITEATNSMAILCDNVYRRVKDQSCGAHVKVELEKSGKLTRISQTQLDAESFVPKTVVAGEFTVFAKIEKAKSISRASDVIEREDFVGKFPLLPRVLSSLEQSLVPELPAWYVIPQEVVDICKHASVTTGKPTQMRNFLLRGPAGTGKTMGAKAIAAGLGLPYMKYTCSAGTEIFDCATCS